MLVTTGAGCTTADKEYIREHISDSKAAPQTEIGVKEGVDSPAASGLLAS